MRWKRRWPPSCCRADLPVTIDNVVSINSCAAAGCHDNVTGTGGALRLVPGAAIVDLQNPANTVDVIHGTDMFKNFYSSQGVTVVGAPSSSRLFQKAS